MLYIRIIDDYLKILTDKELKDFFSKVAKLLYIFLTNLDEVENHMQLNSCDNPIHHYNVEILNIFDPELKLINTKPMIKKKLKEMLSELKKFKTQPILVLDYTKRNDC